MKARWLQPAKMPAPGERTLRFTVYPIVVLLAYAVVAGLGYLFPTGATLGWVFAILVFLPAWIIGVQILVLPKVRPQFPGQLSLALALILLGSGAATTGNFAYRTEFGEPRLVTLTSVEKYTTPKRYGGDPTVHHDYTIVDAADGDGLGTLKLTGDWVDFQIGDEVEVIFDPTGRVATRLPSNADSLPRGLLITGAILFPLIWLWHVWRYSRRLRRITTRGAR